MFMKINYMELVLFAVSCRANRAACRGVLRDLQEDVTVEVANGKVSVINEED